MSDDNVQWQYQDLDVGGLEPPEPMVLIMEALDLLQPGQRLRVLIDREPHPLYRVLERNGYAHSISTRPDYRFELLIWDPQQAGLSA
ncbi:DUF2249 domain-containing protein [Rugamonas apoptosis]|uniref:DUF2249 domain-containing protein n=1 Tax=Rugamonas apoptosis TaxID=2758570 RepID=A0A7W2IK75_9BURK|nr:DUF2249 domain-containing protein [Rugamonas apoptosis]MBA5687465.1 DUF2249 domain-containing protein [Rugamonas apoptosis]